MIEATAASRALSFVACQTYIADTTNTAGLCRRLRLAGAMPLFSADAVGESYVLLGDTDHNDCLWRSLWELRAEPRFGTAFAERVMPQCPLLSAERGRAIVSPIGLQAPVNSAWVCMGVDLVRFVRRGGEVDERRLEHCLDTCVDVGEALHDAIVWPTADLQHDAWLNRRLAIVVSGFGDVLRAKCMHPSEHDSLRFLNRLLLSLRTRLQSRSRAIAARTEPLPAIGRSDPSPGLPRGRVREDWQRRWQEAARATLVRHRNLLVMSPWGLFPTGSRADYEYAELLPLLRHSDACAFRRNIAIDHWNFNQFKHFHQRARAVLKHRVATSQIAEHV